MKGMDDRLTIMGGLMPAPAWAMVGPGGQIITAPPAPAGFATPAVAMGGGGGGGGLLYNQQPVNPNARPGTAAYWTGDTSPLGGLSYDPGYGSPGDPNYRPGASGQAFTLPGSSSPPAHAPAAPAAPATPATPAAPASRGRTPGATYSWSWNSPTLAQAQPQSPAPATRSTGFPMQPGTNPLSMAMQNYRVNQNAQVPASFQQYLPATFAF